MRSKIALLAGWQTSDYKIACTCACAFVHITCMQYREAYIEKAYTLRMDVILNTNNVSCIYMHSLPMYSFNKQPRTWSTYFVAFDLLPYTIYFIFFVCPFTRSRSLDCLFFPLLSIFFSFHSFHSDDFIKFGCLISLLLLLL